MCVDTDTIRYHLIKLSSLCTWGDNCAYFLACYCLLLRLLGVRGGGEGEDNSVLCSTFLVSVLFQDMLLHDVCTGRGGGGGG